MTRIVAGMLAVILCAFAVAQQREGDTAPGSPTHVSGNLEVLSDTKGVDFGPYLSTVLQTVRTNWYKFIPDEARPPVLKSGKVSIEFAILPDGRVAGMRITAVSGDNLMDRAAWGGITGSNPFAALPSEFHGPFSRFKTSFLLQPEEDAVKRSDQERSSLMLVDPDPVRESGNEYRLRRCRLGYDFIRFKGQQFPSLVRSLKHLSFATRLWGEEPHSEGLPFPLLE